MATEALTNLSKSLAKGSFPTTPYLTEPSKSAERIAQAVRFSPLSIQTKGPLPSASLTEGKTYNDVMQHRDTLASNLAGVQETGSTLSSLERSIGGIRVNPFDNPQRAIENLLYGQRDLSEAGQLDADIRAKTISATEDFYANRDAQTTANQKLFDVPKQQQALAGTRNRIAQRQAKLREDLRSFETDPYKMGGPRALAENERNGVQNQADFELANLSIIESAQLGNLTEARNLAKDLTDRQFDDFQGQIAKYQAQLDALAPKLKAEDEQRADQLKVALAAYQDQAEAERANVKTHRELMAQVAAEGAPQNVIDGVINARSVEEAFSIAGPYLGLQDRLKLQDEMANRRFDNLLSLAKMGQKTAIMELGLTLEDGSAPTDDALAYAAQYAADGKKPTGLSTAGLTFGQVADLARQIPKPTGTLVNAATGVKDGSLGKEIQDDISRLYNIIKLTEELKELDKKRWSGPVAGTIGKIAGSNNQAAYLTKRKAIVDEIARMQTGAALTTDEQSFYNDYLPSRFSSPFGLGQSDQSRIANFEDAMKTKLNNALGTYNLSIYGYSTIKVGEQEYKVGQVITNADGQNAIVQPDGSVALIRK